jgi:integrase
MSKAKLRSATYSINEMTKKVNGYSYASKADMRVMLTRCIKDLHQLGFKLSHIKGLKPKHIHALVDQWQSQDKSTGTIKNYMSKLRKAALILDKPKLVKPDNEAYNISKRSYTPKSNKAIHLIDFDKCKDPLIRLSIEAQALFGLRREESIKMVLSEALQGGHLNIKPSWTKGGVGRILEISTDEQRQWINKALQVIQSGKSLIPKERSYKQHLRHYQKQTELMGVSKLHGLRHAYAQRRYFELTKKHDPLGIGWQCPINGGKQRNELTFHERQIDKRIRLIISNELGHSRLSITKIYCG